MAAEHVEVTGLSDLLRALKRYDADSRKELVVELRKMAKVVAADAKDRAAWSRRIPQSIATSVTAKGASIKIKRGVAPHGAVLEGGKRNAATFRHPVFGNRDVWVTQKARPFLRPAVESHRERLVAETEHLLNNLARKSGL